MIWKNLKCFNTLIYILHSTEHLILFKRASGQKLCLITQPGLLYKISSYSSSTSFVCIILQICNCYSGFCSSAFRCFYFTLNLNDLVGHRHYCNE